MEIGIGRLGLGVYSVSPPSLFPIDRFPGRIHADSLKPAKAETTLAKKQKRPPRRRDGEP